MSQINDFYCEDNFPAVAAKISYILYLHKEFVLAKITKPIHEQKCELETLLCQVKTVKSCKVLRIKKALRVFFCQDLVCEGTFEFLPIYEDAEKSQAKI